MPLSLILTPFPINLIPTGIKRLQTILMKVALLFGVRIYTSVEFLKIKEPTDSLGWHASFKPHSHELNSIDFHIIVGGEGKKQQIPGFDRKELRAKLALAITANFTNHRTQQEAAVEEISGVAFIFNQGFFKQLKEDTGIDLENIVYYKDDTHYFIMTAKKESLLLKGVLKKVCKLTTCLSIHVCVHTHTHCMCMCVCTPYCVLLTCCCFLYGNDSSYECLKIHSLCLL